MSKVPVRVYIRIRPLLEHETVRSSEVCVQVEGEDQLVLGVDKMFRFDRVFPPIASQAMVYECAVEPLVKACVEGYNSTVFAYGQSGSGKSFTMGSELGWRAEEDRGIIPRALEDLFQSLPSNTASSVCVSYVEIYKDELRDLLGGVLANHEGGVAGKRGEVIIREDSQGNTAVLGCASLMVSSAEEALGWLEVGNSSRATGATYMNQRSSRSHAIFTVHIQQKWQMVAEGPGDAPTIKSSSTLGGGGELEQCLSAKFHFVDLAGSERVSKTGNQGERFKESVHINSGLLALGNVISALGGSKKQFSHIPYRDSKITRVLKDSLGGNARTVMITCLSPAAVNLTESLNSLKYAKRARNIHNRPVVNRDTQSRQLLAMQAEIQSLRDELLKAQSVHSLSTEPQSTVESSLAAPPSELLSRVSELEQELSSARLQCEHYQTALNQARDRVARLLSSASEGVCSAEEAQELLHWMESLNTLPSSGEQSLGADLTTSSLLSAKALQTIELLRSELERCQTDLQTDEDLFAEKLDEVAELQCNYNELAAEKEHLETVWLAAQQSEEQLRAVLEKTLEQLSRVENELAERDGIIQQQKILLSGGQTPEKPSVNEQGPPHEGKEIPSIGTNEEGANGEFLANRSLIVGRVSTSTLEDFSEENVLKSLSALTHILATNRRKTGEDLGRTWTRPHSSAPPLSEIVNNLNRNPISDKGQSARKHSAEASPAEGGGLGVSKRRPKLESLKIHSVDTEEVGDRPTTPVELSTKEPCFSRMGRSESCEAGEGVGSDSVRSVSEMDVLNESVVESRRQLTAAEQKLTLEEDELRNLNLKIRLKEGLIRELVKTGQTTKQLNGTYLAKIQSLEKEVLTVTKELNKSQASLQRASQREVTPDLKKALNEQKKKLFTTEKKLVSLQKKQKETQRLVQFGARRERRVDELEGEVGRLRNQQGQLKRKLKTQADKKIRLESDLQKYQHRIKVLQARSDQQSKVLRVKTEEAAVAQRRLRRMSARRSIRETVTESSESVWLDQEVLRILEQKEAVQALEKELAERERVLQEREALVSERDVLAFKQLQASQATARDILHLSLQIDSIESSLKRKEESRKSSPTYQSRQEEVESLAKERDEVIKKCSELQQKMENGSFLPDKEQRKLCELNEHIEILEAALDFKNRSIDSRQPGLNQVLQQDGSSELQIRSKLEQLPPADLQDLLLRYVDKVVELQMEDHQNTQSKRELAVRVSEQEREIGRLERSLKQSTAAGERQLLALQREHEQQVQLLVQQLADLQLSPLDPNQTQTLRDKIKQLEKDLYYYKKTSRDLRKKLNQDVSAKDSISVEASLLATEGGCVEDSLSSVRSGVLSRKGPVSETNVKSGVLSEEPENAVSLQLETDGRCDDDSRKTKSKSKVVRKSKKQLRQLSVSEIAERKSQKEDNDQ